MKSLDEYISDQSKYQLNTQGLGTLIISFKYANGCGSKGNQKFLKTIWGVNIESTCIGHDIRWELAENYDDLIEANEIFDNDLKKICDQESNWFTRPIRRMRIAKYISAVELYGTNSYAQKRGFDRRV